jgi:anti-anti-sigma factor
MFSVEQQGAVQIIRCRAALTAEHAESLRTTAEACFGGGRPMLVLGLREVPLTDSRGLETLLDLQDEAERLGGSVKLAAPSALTADALRITGVGERFESFETVKAAAGSYAR